MLRHDAVAGAGMRRGKLVQAVFVQGILVVVILMASYFSKDDAKTLALTLWTLVVPLGFATSYVLAHRTGEAARSARTWTPQMEAATAKRMVSRLGMTLVLWFVGLALIWWRL